MAQEVGVSIHRNEVRGAGGRGEIIGVHDIERPVEIDSFVLYGDVLIDLSSTAQIMLEVADRGTVPPAGRYVGTAHTGDGRQARVDIVVPAATPSDRPARRLLELHDPGGQNDPTLRHTERVLFDAVHTGQRASGTETN